MKKITFLFIFLIFISDVSADDCDCSNYPFRPNPPCYGICVAKLVTQKNADLTTVKNIDPGVSVGIKVLSEGSDHINIDYVKIKGKEDLERAALKKLNSKYQDQ